MSFKIINKIRVPQIMTLNPIIFFESNSMMIFTNIYVKIFRHIMFR